MGDVFLSYARKDEAAARVIRSRLAESGFAISGGQDILPGEAFTAALQRMMDKASAVVLLWSADSAASPWVEAEVKLALKAWARDALVVAALDETPLPAGLRDQVAVSRSASASIEDFAGRVRSELAVRTFREPKVPPSAPTAAAARTRATWRTWLGWTILISLLLAGAALLTIKQDVPYSGGGGPVIEPAFVLLIASACAAVIVLWRLISYAVFRFGARRATTATSSAPVTHAASGTKELFISYSRKDAAAVDRLVSRMEAEGLGVWIDRKSPDVGGQRYAGPIVKAIRESGVIAVMCSRHAFDSDHVVREVYVAGDFKKPFLNVHLDSTEFPDDLRYFLTGYPRVPAGELEQASTRDVITPLLQGRRA